MSVGEGYRDTWACDDSDKSPRRQNKARLPQICFQCSSVGELDDGWTGAGRNTSVSKLLTIIKTCFFPLPFASLLFQPPTVPQPTTHFISFQSASVWFFLHCSIFPPFLNSISNLFPFHHFYPFLLLLPISCILSCLHPSRHNMTRNTTSYGFLLA